MKTQILFLDDDKNRCSLFAEWFSGLTGIIDIDFVENANDAMNKISSKYYDFICLDHDLGGMVYVDSQNENTGYQVAKFIAGNKLLVPRIVIHSWNPVGAKNMTDILEDYDPVYIPFSKDIALLIQSEIQL